MKKWLLTIISCLCLLTLTACGSDVEKTYLDDEMALQMGSYYSQIIYGVVQEGSIDEFVYNADQEQPGLGTVITAACDSMSKAMTDMGTLNAVGSLLSNTLEIDSLGNPVGGSIEVELQGSERDAVFELVFERGEFSSFTTNVKYTFGESMEKAALNTLLGMGTVFIVLILISFIISAFNLIPKIQGMFKKDKTPASNAVDSTIAQIIEKEELSDDLELVAVISAAIASYEGTSSDGFVVRSIRRAR